MRCGVLVLAAALLAAACSPTPTQRQLNAVADAQVSAGLTARAAAAEAAADRFVVLAQGAQVTGKAPRQSDPGAGPLLDAVFETSAIPLTTRTLDDARALDAWLVAVGKVGKVYVFAGAGPGPALTDAVRAQSDRNLVTYALELGRYSDAEVVLLSRDAATLYYLQATGGLDASKKAAALDALQTSVSKGYGGALALIAEKPPTDAWKQARAGVLAQMAPRVAPALRPQTWHALQDEARRIAANSGDAALKRELGDFSARIEPPGA